jgi:hypothetical protein
MLAKNTASEVPEERLLRDVIYTFQGCHSFLPCPPLLLQESTGSTSNTTRDWTVTPSCARSTLFVFMAQTPRQAGVPAPTRNLIRRICELGWMYRKVCEFLTGAPAPPCPSIPPPAATLDSPSVGLVEQSLCGTLQQELTDYYRLIAVLETQLTRSQQTGSAAALLSFDSRVAAMVERKQAFSHCVGFLCGCKTRYSDYRSWCRARSPRTLMVVL